MENIIIKIGKKRLKAQLLTTASELTNGLMFKKGTVLMKLPKQNRAYAAIHTFFCKSMTIAWLDKNLRVLETVSAKPFRFYIPKNPAAYVFENTDNIKVKKGNRLSCKKN